jgi:protein-histidine pros-kinase
MQAGTLSFRIAPNNRWFTVLAALAVIPFLLSAGYSLVQLSQSKQDDASEQLVIKANNAALVIKERLAASVAALNAIASSDAALHNDLPALYLQAQRVMQRMPENNSIALISPDGSVIFSTLQSFGSPTFPSRVPAAWKRVFNTAGPAVSEPFVNPISDRSSAAIGVPIFQQGKVAYCLGMVLLTSSINDLLMAQQLPQQWPIEVISDTGKVLAHSHVSEIDIGKPAPDEIISAKRAQTKGLFSTHTREGEPAQAILVPVGNFDWSVAMTVPMSTLNEPVRNVILMLVIFGGAFAILGGLAVILPNYLLREIPAAAGVQTPAEISAAARPSIHHLGPSLIALAASIVLGGYTAWLTQNNIQRITASLDTHQQIHVAQSQVEDLDHLLKDVETGQRGFAITGNEIFLAYFRTASQKIPALTDRIKTGFSKAEPQGFNWNDFDSLSDQYMQFSAKVIAMRHGSGASAKEDEALLDSGKLILDKLQLQLNEMNIRLDKRTSQAAISITSQLEQASQQQWLSSFAVSSLFLISIALWIYERQRRIQVHTQLEVSNSLLEDRIAQRTHDLGAANQRLLLYAQQAQALVDSERKRLSREVHDQVGQIFTGIKMIASSLKSGELDTAQHAALLNAAETGVKISRRIAAELRPPLLDDFGLPTAIEHFLKSCCEPLGLSFEVQFPEEHRLASLQMSELFRIVQEACVNVTRHAKAMHLEVVGRIAGDSLDVCVDDDGVGFDQALVREGALGILGMHERANLIDAQVHIGSSPMGGTRVNIRLRLAEHSEEERA